MKGQVIHYPSENYLSNIPTLNDIAIENEGLTERINKMYCYVLHLYSCLINGQKALVTLIGIQIFFDILIPVEEILDECEEEDYHIKKKSYLQIYTNGIGERKKDIQAIQEIISKPLWMIYIHSTKRKRKYSDAYLFPPKKGIERGRPITGLDFASLYSSIIMAYNLFPEKFIFDLKDADITQMEKKGLYLVVLKDLFNKRLKLKACLALLGKKSNILEDDKFS
ncbi:6125_t:CDS:2 [Funneliformis geosporum]|nr:6125_t:CDS:2 [Funneliformis geosporum]